MLLLNDFNRFSVDIDILMNIDMLDKINDSISNYTDDIFYSIKEDKRKPVEIVKKHFKLYYKSIYPREDTEDYILLDIVFDEYKYCKLELRAIDSHFVKTTDPLLMVKIPAIDCMIGDKLTAFAPKTIGILYKRPNERVKKYTEIIKQLYDVGKLYDKISDISVVKETYKNVALIQMKNRCLNITVEDCLMDSILACKLIMTEGVFGGYSDEYEIIKKGYIGLKNYTLYPFGFEELSTLAAKVYILCIRLLYDDDFDEEAKPRESFVGRKYKILDQRIGHELYKSLMQVSFIENKYK